MNRYAFSVAALLDLDAGFLDDFGHFGEAVAGFGCQLLGRGAAGFESQSGQPLAYRRIVDRFHRLRVQPLDDRLWRPARHVQCDPRRELESRQTAFGCRGDVRQQTAALIKARRLKALATTGLARERLLPEVPTVAESGLKNFEVMTWYGVMAPAGVPPAIIGRIHADMTRVIRQPDIQAQFSNEGGEVVANTPEQFAALIERELVKWSKVAKAAGAKVD